VTATELTLTSGTDTIVDEAANTGRVVQGLFGTTCVAGVNIETTATTVVRASGSFVTDGFQVGQRVRLIGFTGGDVGNNQIVKITGVVALTLTVEASPALTVTSAAAGRAIFGDHVRDGVIKRSFAAQRKYEDLTNKFISYRGLRVSKLSLTIAARSIMKLAFTLMGKKGVSGSSAFISTSTPASKNRVYAAGTNVASVKEGGAVLSQACSEFSFEVDAGLYAVDTIESKEHESIDLGTTMIKGKAKLYFKNFDYYDKFQNHTESGWEVQVRDGDLNVYHYTIPSIRYTASPIGTPGKNQSLFADMSWTAIHNNTFNCEMMIDRIPV
jgi:hypothetical protein